MVMPKRSSPIGACLLAAVLAVATVAAQGMKPDWKNIAQRFPVVAVAFGVVDRDGYDIDVGRQATKETAPFLVASVPVFPKGKTAITTANLTTAQHIAVLITSVIESQLQDVIPTEAIIIDAQLDVPSSRLYFHGQNGGSRIEGTYDPAKKTIDMKIYETILSRATARLDAPAGCQDQLFKGESASCSQMDVGCVLAAWIYSHDQCRRAKR